MKHIHRQRGVSLVETIIAVAILAMVSIALYSAAAGVFTVARSIHTKTVLAEIASQRMEFIRNLAYANIGTEGGIPSGVIAPSETITRNGQSFLIETTIRNIDNPADGVLGGIPNDLSPADNKFIRITVSCPECQRQESVSFSSTVAPKNLETENGNGVLLIKVVDANGVPLSGAQVSVKNDALIPKVSILDITDVHGMLAIVDAPPSVQGYQVRVTKDGYSSEETYPYGAPENPTPIKPHLTVAANSVTQDTFAIDRLAHVALDAKDVQCNPVAGVEVAFTGAKLIGTPSLRKHEYALTTDAVGQVAQEMEWDSYGIGVGIAHTLAALSVPMQPQLAPGTTVPVSILLQTGSERGIGVTVFDTTGQGISDPSVTLSGQGITFALVGGELGRYVAGGQTSVESADSGIAYSDTTTTLSGAPGTYALTGSFISSPIDMGAGASLTGLSLSTTTPPGTSVGFQIATNSDGVSWEFKGPDGTDQTLYSAATALTTSARYVKYRVVLTTSDPQYAPNVIGALVKYRPACIGPEQVYIGGIPSGTYQLEVVKPGFATQTKTITIPTTTYEAITLSSQ